MLRIPFLTDLSKIKLNFDGAYASTLSETTVLSVPSRYANTLEI